MGFSLLLWGSGLDLTIQAWLFKNYDQEFNNIFRILGWLGKGSTQMVFTLIVGAALALRWLSADAARYKLVAQKGVLRAWKTLPRHITVWFQTLPVFLTAGVLAIGLKLMVGRPRPKEYFFNHLPYGELHPIWQHGAFKASLMSWPSGHSASTFAIGTLLLLAFPRHKILILSAMIVLSASRFLALTPHYLGDVVAGATLGTLVALLWAPYLGLDKKAKR